MAAATADTVASLELFVSFHLNDINEIRSTRKGKRREGAPVSDEELAFQAYLEELRLAEQSMKDAKFAASIQEAVNQDYPILEQFQQLEQQEDEDRQMALQLSRPSSRADSVASSRASDRRNAARASPAPILPAAQNVARVGLMPKASTSGKPMQPQTTGSSGTASASRPVAGDSRTAASKAASTTAQKTVQCVICMDRLSVRDAIRVPCKARHYYGKDCLKSLVLSAMKDESLMPPKCDQATIPENLYIDLLSAPEQETFHAKRDEFSTANRLYCCNPTCSKWLGSASTVKKSVKCDSCRSKTCGACKGPWVASHPICGGDADEIVVDELRKEGLQRCPSCRRVIELIHGCNHLTCICRKEFCFVCSATWKTCACEIWDEARLLATAQARAQPGHNVQEVADALRDDHACDHQAHGFHYRNGGGECDNCFQDLPNFLLRCRGCGIAVCVRCQRNRF